MLHLNPVSSSSKSPEVLEESMQKVIKSTEDIINDDFEQLKFSELSLQDYSWSPIYGSSQALNTPTHERKPFEPLNHYPGVPHPNTFQRFSPNQTFTQDHGSFAHHQERKQPSPSENVNGEQFELKVRKLISDAMKQYGNNLSTPILKVSVVGISDYELDEKDIVNLFARFGSIIKILVLNTRTAYVVLDDIVNALAAQKSLNKCYLRDLNITLYVNFCHNLEEDVSPKVDIRSLAQIPNVRKQQSNNSSDKENDYAKSNKRSIFTFGQDISFLPNTTTKFTCKYEVQIENEKEFRVAQKIIGSRGYNMKRIIEICQSQAKNPNILYKNDFLKLRLRGKGSGFKEGRDQKESEEPIHLCVSSRYIDVFETACRLVEELLTYVYKEYEVFCKVIGRRGNFPLRIKKIETYCGVNGDRQTPENYVDTFNCPNNFNLFSSPTNNQQMYYPNENYIYGQTTPSPKNNNFQGENRYRQFGQERMVNCFIDKIQQSPCYHNETTALQMKHN